MEMCVISPILTKEFNKLNNATELFGQVLGSSMPVYGDWYRVHLCYVLTNNWAKESAYTTFDKL